MKLSKTETKLLTIARQYGGHYSIETCYGRGSYGGRRNYGARDRNAMFKLEKAGLIRIVSRQPWQDYNRGYSQSGNVFCFELV